MKIVKICDVFEALTAVRPYKPRMSPVRAYRIMMGMKDHFDPRMLRAFVQLSGLYPVGSRVRLSSGDTARVQKQTSDPARPVVDIEVIQDEELVPPSDRKTLDLQVERGKNPPCGGRRERDHERVAPRL